MTNTTDPFLFDTEQLQTLADDRELRAGLADYRSQCVTEMQLDEQGLFAGVEDSSSGEVLSTQLHYDVDGNLFVTCGCEYAGEGLCRHGVALLYTYAADQGDELLGAVMMLSKSECNGDAPRLR